MQIFIAEVLASFAASFPLRHQHPLCFYFCSDREVANYLYSIVDMCTCTKIHTLIPNTMAIFSFRHSSSPLPPDSLYADPKFIEYQVAPGTEDQYAMVDKKGKKNTKPEPTPPEALYQVLLCHTLEVFRM